MIQVSLLQAINDKLSILKMMHADIKELKTSLKFTQSQIDTLQAENNDLELSVGKLTTEMEIINNENKRMKETILDLQSRSMRKFIQSALKLSHDTVKNITFHRVHHTGVKNNSNRLRPIVTKYYYYYYIIISDHAPISLQLLTGIKPQPTPRWHFNISLLKDPDFTTYFK